MSETFPYGARVQFLWTPTDIADVFTVVDPTQFRACEAIEWSSDYVVCQRENGTQFATDRRNLRMVEGQPLVGGHRSCTIIDTGDGDPIIVRLRRSAESLVQCYQRMGYDIVTTTVKDEHHTVVLRNVQGTTVNVVKLG